MLKSFSFLLFLLLFIGCGSTNEEVQMVSVNGKWPKKKEFPFKFNIKDAQHPKNIIFVVRNNNDFPYSNIWFIVNFTNLQTKKKTTDTLNYIMAKPNGEWIGSGFGKTKEILFQYKVNYQFPENGNYQIGINQAMRNDNLPGIEDIGVKIESFKKP